MTLDLGLWNAIVSTVTLLVVAGAAFAALRQIRQLRAQTTLAGLLKVLDDWRDPEFRRTMSYVQHELQAKLQDPAFLEEFDHPLDPERHPEMAICAWYEQIGSYMKHGLLDEHVMMDVSSSSSNTMWHALEPVVLRMRQTRSDAVFENFEYMAARGVLFERAHPNGCYPRHTPRMSALGGAHAFGKPIERAAASETPQTPASGGSK